MKKIVATFLFVGYMRPASGTWGSLAALPFVWVLHELGSLIHPYGGPVLLGLAAIAAFYAGLWATPAIVAESGREDPSEVVIDEVVGMWIAMLPVSIGAAMVSADILALYPGWIAAFFAFRAFDIWKPGPIGWADRRGDAMGVMLDDVLAGIVAGVVTIALAAVSHLWLMG